MLYLAFIFHMHQPYYKNLLTGRIELPWVRLHGIKDYLDMVQLLEKFPRIHQTFNVVPSLLEQVEDYVNGNTKERFLELSLKPANELSHQDKQFILENFFSIDRENVIARFPRYYELYLNKSAGNEFNSQDFLDLQVWFNLAWFDPSFIKKYQVLRDAVSKGRFYNEKEKRQVLDKQIEILGEIIPYYKQALRKGQLELSVSPFYHPILPLLCNTQSALEANPSTPLPQETFVYPQDAKAQVEEAVKFYNDRFGQLPQGMWPSEEAVSEDILPILMKSGINWIVADEGILFRSLNKKKRETSLLYQAHQLKRNEGTLNIIFRDRNLSDLIGFNYRSWRAEDAVNDFLSHLNNIAASFKKKDVMVAVAMDGENAWEYFLNDGHDFLELLYARLSEAKNITTVTVSEYMSFRKFSKARIDHLSAGSWIYSEFSKWIGNVYKNKAWDYLTHARKEFERAIASGERINPLAWKQMCVAEGSDWFWWYGDRQRQFDELFRTHLSNFYTMINREPPEYLRHPLEP